jgi:hypothetical protein
MKKPLNSCLLILSISSLFFLNACTSGNDTISKDENAIPQTFEITVNGKNVIMDPDKPDDGLVVTAASGRSGGGLILSAINQPEDFSFQAIKYGPLEAGTFQVFTCHGLNDCQDDNGQTAMFGIYPTGDTPKITDGKYAYKSQQLGLQPLTLVVTSVEDVYWPGVGPSKRVKGTFKGELATVDKNANSELIIIGDLAKIEGKFDLYCVLK